MLSWWNINLYKSHSYFPFWLHQKWWLLQSVCLEPRSTMVGKRKVDQLRTNIAKMARAAESGDKEEFQKASQNVPNLLEKTNIQSHIERLEVNGSTKEEYFAKVLRTSTPLDRVYEYLVFKRNLRNSHLWWRAIVPPLGRACVWKSDRIEKRQDCLHCVL